MNDCSTLSVTHFHNVTAHKVINACVFAGMTSQNVCCISGAKSAEFW